MPRREASAYVWDVRDAAMQLREILHGWTIERYLQERVIRLAVERLLITLGEAVSQLAKADPALAAELGPVAQIVAFRNILVHAYFTIDHREVWRTLENDLPKLLERAEAVWSRYADQYTDRQPEP